VRLLGSLWPSRRSIELDLLIADYKQVTARLREATREMEAALAYITTEREEVLDRLHKMELQISALKLAVKRR
jgi:hypothetical protein